MSYADRRIAQAYRLVEEFARNKVRQDIRPDIVHHQIELDYNSRTEVLSRKGHDLDGWIVTVLGDRCIVALEDGGILEGELKLRSWLFRHDRNKTASYAYWKEYSKDKVLWGSRKLTVNIAEAIVATLDSTTSS